MRLEPDTPLGSLLAAIPTASHVLRQLGITIDGNEDKTLGQVCRDHGIRFDDFLSAMNEVDWEQEPR